MSISNILIILDIQLFYICYQLKKKLIYYYNYKIKIIKLYTILDIYKIKI